MMERICVQRGDWGGQLEARRGYLAPSPEEHAQSQYTAYHERDLVQQDCKHD